ncbi:CBS domain-containing protein CBSX5-like [Nicotiana sylvestris]|uniref:CBS domain-containing protein CBSX5-like n=1 Tax=Nicotiana sylvestris TaxID=4096 RepID=UPI00388CB7C5
MVLEGDDYSVECHCIGKVSMVDVICYLCKQESLIDSSKVLEIPVLKILAKGDSIVKHLEPDSSLLEAIDHILEGIQNLEDVVLFLLNSIGVFSPMPTFSIELLNIIDHNILTVRYHDPEIFALDSIALAHIEQIVVAVVDDDNRLIGEISPSTLAYCDESVAAAITTLSAGDLMAYIDYGGPPEGLVELVNMRLHEKKTWPDARTDGRRVFRVVYIVFSF